MAANQVPVLEKPTVVDRSMGDVHPGGNPHVHLNPENILIIAGELGKRMMALDPDNAAYYGGRLSTFAADWRNRIAGWKKRSGIIIICSVLLASSKLLCMSTAGILIVSMM